MTGPGESGPGRLDDQHVCALAGFVAPGGAPERV